MTFYLFDSEGFVGDLASINGLMELRNLLDDRNPVITKLFDKGYAENIVKLQESISDIISTDEDINSTLDNFKELLKKCKDIAIIIDGARVEEAETNQKELENRENKSQTSRKANRETISVRKQRALELFKPSDRTIQDRNYATLIDFVQKIGGEATKGNHPFDAIKGNNVFEVITIGDEHKGHLIPSQGWATINPDDAEDWYDRGIALDDVGEYSEAIEFYKLALSIDPEYTKAQLSLGLAYTHIGKFEEAVALLKKIIKRLPDNVEARSTLADIYLLLQKFREAEKQLRKAIQIEPENGSFYADLGHILTQLKKEDGALNAFKKALELEPDIPVRYYNVGDTYLALGNAEQSVPFLEKASQMAPHNSLYHYDLGLAFFNLRKYDQCVNESEAALRNDPDMRFALTNLGLSATANLGLAYMNLEKYAEAEACFQRILRKFAPACFNLGLTLFKQKKFEESLVNFKRAVELVPDDPEYWDLVGNAYLELNRLEEAREVLQKAIDIDDTYALAHHDLGCVFARMPGQEEEALKSFHRATTLIQDDPHPYYGIACIYALQGKRELALDFLEKTLEKGLRDWIDIDANTDLNSIRNDKRYKKMKKKYFKIANSNRGRKQYFLNLSTFTPLIPEPYLTLVQVIRCYVYRIPQYAHKKPEVFRWVGVLRVSVKE